MKIAFYNVTASFVPGGLETYCWELGRTFAARGHDVSIYAGNRGEARHPEVRLVQFPFRAEKQWPNLGTRFRRLMERLSFARHSMAALVDGGFDAVIVNKPFDFPILFQARRRGLRARTLFRSGGTDFFAGDRFFADAIDHWVSTSAYNAGQIEERYGHPVDVIHNGVDTARFFPGPANPDLRSGFGIPPEAVVLVSVGRLVGWKGLQTIVEALQSTPEQVHYLIVGEGDQHAELERSAQSSGVLGRVHFAGRIGHAELPGLLRACDLFVQPSIGEEAFGISVVEAMASGLPVLVSDQGGLREIVADESCGLRLPPGGVAAWQHAITALARDARRRTDMGAAARERVVAHFTWAANAVRHEALLSERVR